MAGRCFPLDLHLDHTRPGGIPPAHTGNEDCDAYADAFEKLAPPQAAVFELLDQLLPF